LLLFTSLTKNSHATLVNRTPGHGEKVGSEVISLRGPSARIADDWS
jgi:hypothetical protein